MIHVANNPFAGRYSRPNPLEGPLPPANPLAPRAGTPQNVDQTNPFSGRYTPGQSSVPGGFAPSTPSHPLVQAAGGFVASPVVQSGLRFITSALSPLQASQDITFAVAGGALDPNRSTLDYLGQMEWANYAPWNRAPVRPIEGQALARLSGVEDERTSRAIGMALDFVADPLIVGSLLRGIGRAAKLPGLMRAGNVIDTVAESSLLVGGVPTARVVRATRALPGFAAVEQAAWQGFARRYVMPMLDAAENVAFLPASARRGGIPIGGGERRSVSGMFVVDGGRLPGAQDALSRVGGAAEELADNSAVAIMRAMAAAGDPRWKRQMRQLTEAQSLVYDIPVPLINAFAPEVSRGLMKAAYGAAEEVGVLNFAQRLDDLPSPSPLIQRAQRDVADIADVMMAHPLSQQARIEFRARTSRFNEEHARLRDLARRYGNDPDLVSTAFNKTLEQFQRSSALEGYFASGYGPLSEVFTTNTLGELSKLAARNPAMASAVARAGGAATVARTAWRDLIGFGADGVAATRLDEPVRLAVAQVASGAPPLPTMPTYRQLFGEYADIPGLNVGVWLDSIPRGHMRRAFGVFQDQDSWRRAVGALEDGRVRPTRLLDEPRVLGQLATEFPGETSILQRYMDDMTPRSGNKPTGGLVTATEVAEHMSRQGVPSAQIESFWARLGEIADPEIAQLASDLRRYGAQTVGDIPSNAPQQFTGAKGVFRTERQDLNRDTLSMLMELMDPALSRTETAVAASRAMRRTEGLAELYRLSKGKGLIRDAGDATTPNWWTSVAADQAHAYPFLAGKTVHPMLFREMNNLLAQGAQTTGFTKGLATVRQMVTAGYLANPATTTANVAGGFWTAFLHGINPLVLAREMAETWQTWSKLGRDLPELAHMRDIVQNGITHSDLIKGAGKLRLKGMNLGSPEGLQGLTRAMGEGINAGIMAYGKFLRRPLGVKGSGALGLGAFELSESLFRMATFRMIRKQGGSVEEARRLARFVVFDYAAQPGTVRLARDTGVFLFPAFPYFMFGRTMNAMFKNPAVLATGERTAELMWNLNTEDEGQRHALYGGMEDWMREDKYIPVRRQEDGDVTMLPLNQLIPTNTLTGKPFVDSLATLGLWGPLIDIVTALTQGSEGGGPATITGNFGRQVFPENTAARSDRLVGALKFAFNSFAPGIARKLVRFPEDTTQRYEGAIPNLARALQPPMGEYGNMGRNVNELLRRRADQDIVDSILSLTIRSTRTVATEGDLADVTRILASASAQRDRDLSGFERRIAIATARGNEGTVQNLTEQRMRFIERWKERWDPIVDMYRNLEEQGRVGQGRLTW